MDIYVAILFSDALEGVAGSGLLGVPAVTRCRLGVYFFLFCFPLAGMCSHELVVTVRLVDGSSPPTL